MAAMALQGRSANGWLEWKSLQGKTLDEMKRQSVTGAGRYVGNWCNWSLIQKHLHQYFAISI